ncbi:MAG TPA: ABC transporter ATP-binding protein [Rhodanobacteraceae bacterium]|nr:ABC transporter ATP-binding protein [Rhodanobacteraceae bacterium]
MSESQTPILELRAVSRRRGGRPAVREVSLAVRRGEVLGLLGVNGAGKSTTLSMMVGALAPDTGSVWLDGLDLAEHPQALRSRVGWLPERAPLYDELTVIEQLDAAASLHGLRAGARRAAREPVLERLQLGDLRQRLVGHLSQGQRQRVGLACALIHAPALLVLDEPCNGLDPVQVVAWRRLVAEFAAEDRAVIVSTHVLAEVAASCNRVAILHQGTLRHDARIGADVAALEQRFFTIATQTESA